MSDQGEIADLELRIFEKEARGYPIELTLNSNQQFPRGFLNPAERPELDLYDPVTSGEALFEWLIPQGPILHAWAMAR